MPTFEITSPDGVKYEVTAPEGASEQEILAYAQSQFSKKQPGASGSFAQQGGASGQWQPEKPSGFRRGFLDDPITGLRQLGAETEIAALLAPDWARKTKQSIQSDEQAYQAARGEKGMDWPRLGGQMINPVNLGLAALTKTPPGASLPMRMGMSGVGGAMMGWVAPVYGDATREGQAAAGGVGGVVAAPIAGGVARVVKPNVSPAVAQLKAEGVTPTVGQAMGGALRKVEDRFTSFPIMGDAIDSARKHGMDQFQTAAYNRALKPIGQKAGSEVGHEGMIKVHKALSDAYDDLLPKMSFKPDAQHTQEIAQLRAAIRPLGGSAKIFDNVMNDVKAMATPQGNMSGETFKLVEEKLGKEITALMKDPSYEKGKIAEALQQVREIYRQGLSRSNPMHAQQLAKINEGWANYAILRRAASGPQAAQTGNFTPSQLMQGVQESAKRGGQAVGRGKLSEGKALMQDLAAAGYEVLPSKYPDSGTAGRILQDVLLNPIVGLPKMAMGMTVGGVGSIPYLPGVRNAASWALTGRQGQIPGLLSDVIRRSPALAAPIAPSMIYGLD